MQSANRLRAVGFRSGAASLPLVALLLATASGCARGPKAAAGGQQTPDTSAPAWQSALDRDHPLVGRIYHAARGQFIAEQTLVDALARAPLVILGEKHDNADHHALQARLIERMVARGRRPALVFEMLDASDQPAIDRALAAHPGDVDALAAAVDWAHSGWPPWRVYRPVFAAGLAARLPIAAAGLDAAIAMRIAREGTHAVPEELARRYGLADPLPPDVSAALQAEMRAAHCDLLPDAMLGAMVLVQRVRDAQFAERLYTAAQGRGGVLITGNGHARSDRGVPAALRRGRGTGALSVALLEVQREWRAPADYAAAFGASSLPFDYAWFTPRASDDDPCAELRARHARP